MKKLFFSDCTDVYKLEYNIDLYFQERIQAINEEIRHVRNRIDGLRSAGERARGTNNVKELQSISQQLEFANVKYNSLVQEQHEHNRILQQQSSELTTSGISR